MLVLASVSEALLMSIRAFFRAQDFTLAIQSTESVPYFFEKNYIPSEHGVPNNEALAVRGRSVF